MTSLTKILLRIIPVSELIKLVWNILDPILKKKVDDSKSSIDDKVYTELQNIINKLIQGLKL